MKNLLILVFALLFSILGCSLEGLLEPLPNLNGLTPDDIDCNNHLDFDHVEPLLLPSERFYGRRLYERSYPTELVTDEGTFFHCEDTRIRRDAATDIRRYADGTMITRWRGDYEDDFYTYLRIAEYACNLDPYEELPYYSGEWVVIESDPPYLCSRIHLIPGVIFCQELSNSIQKTLVEIQNGREVPGSSRVIVELCTLEEE